ncbi:hypothetical protein ACB092_09G002400 [Castanea dentata]
MESDEMIPIEIKYGGEDIDLEDELDEVAELPPPKKAKTKSKNKTNNKDNKRRTSYVWSFFELLPTKDKEKAYMELLCAAITMHELPFRFVEYVGIREIFSYLCVDVPNISKNTAKNDLVKMYKREKERMKSVLTSAPTRVCLTSDLWTSTATDGYMCVIAHFIDANWVLQKRVYKLLSMWGVENKIFCVTLDNASSNDVSIDMLRTQLINKKALVCNGEFFHLRCCAHILNLVVQDGLKEIDVVQKIHESIKYVRESQGRKKKGSRQDVPTRWNSTFLMLQNALSYRRAFQHLELTDYNFKYCPTVDEWKKAEKIKKFLAVFYDATLVFFGTKYPTANLYFPQVFIVYFTLKKESDNEDEYMRKMANQMLLSFIDWCYQKLYGYASSLQYLKVREKLFALFGEYVSNVPTPSTSSGMVGPATQETEEQYAKEGSLNLIPFIVWIWVGKHQKTQLELYLDEPRVDRNAKLDILAFWKGNEFRYPELAAMARDILSIPISTVASESTFSVWGRVIDQFRSALKPDVVEASVCTRDSLYADIGNVFFYLHVG